MGDEVESMIVCSQGEISDFFYFIFFVFLEARRSFLRCPLKKLKEMKICKVT